MAQNFVLEHKTASGYDELLPSTTADNIVGAFIRKMIQVTIPATTELVQSIVVNEITADMAEMPFYVYYISGDKSDFKSIVQVEAKNSSIELTRLYYSPKNEVTIGLLFYTTVIEKE